jgi:sigma-B regulation protein RsbU (phosphoserine phosphatase)
MGTWFRSTSWFQRIALALLLIALCTWRSEPIFLAALVCFFAFRRQMLWRVRNRLLITFLLFGVVPIFLIFWLFSLTATLMLGQFASERVRQDLDARIERIHAVTQNLMLAVSHGARYPQLDEILQREPGLFAVVLDKGKPVMLPSAHFPFRSPPDWLSPGFKGVLESDGRYYLGARSRDAAGNDAFTYLPFDDAMLATLTPGIVAVTGMIGGSVNTNIGFTPSGSTVSIVEGGTKRLVQTSALPPRRHSWDISIATLLNWQAATASGKPDEILMPILSRPSLLLAGVVTGRMASVIVSVLIIVVGFFLLVEVVSLISSLRLTRTITRSVHDLYQGTRLVSAGDFSHQIPVRGRHQLSDLATAFNGMTKQIQHYLGEMRKKEKLESELEIARQVQSRLFPRAVPELKTLEMAGLCLPGRVVSGDYYDFVKLNDRFTAIALGDVSGKGVSAALLMASIQSSLHAQLKFSGGALSPSLSTATLMGLISQQLYESTPAEKYATFFCSVYDDETSVLRYTNCGHLKPILIRAGQVSALDGDGMVVGLLPNVTYDQLEVQLQSGDLLAIFSDGIPEAENASEQEFGEQRLGELLSRNASEPLDKIIQIVTESVHAWIHDPEGQDDTTIVLLRKR